MNHETQGKFRLLIKDLLSMPNGSVRPRDMNAPAEGKSFVMVHVSSVRSTGWSGQGKDDEQFAVATVLFDFFGEDALMRASKLHKVMQSNKAVEGLEKLGMGYLSSGTVINLTGLELERIERYQVSIDLSLLIGISGDGFDVDNLNEVNINLIAEQ